MLLVQTQTQRFFAVGIERNQIVIIVGAAMHHAAHIVNGGIDQRGGDAAILRLHVKSGLADLYVRIVTKHHFAIRFRPKTVRL